MSEPSAAALVARFHQQLRPAEASALQAARAWSENADAALYLVGGSTRDLLLDVPALDIDIAVEGDAVALGALLASGSGATLTAHPDFGTAIVQGAGWRIDLARTRTEQYVSSGALPAVRPAGIIDDLARRDFAANAIALRLAPQPPVLVDPLGGTPDVRAGVLRALHSLSFVDDPTRIIRLARYAARLRWQIEATTMNWARAAAPLLANVGAARVWHELERTLAEPRPERALDVLAELPGALSAVGFVRRRRSELADAFAALRDAEQAPTPSMYLAAAAASGATEPGARDSLALPDEEARAMVDAARVLAVARGNALPANTDAVAFASDLDRLSLAAVLGVLAALTARAVPGWADADAGFAASMLDRYRREWRTLRARLDGDALQALGIVPGPALGQLLQRLRAARLLGETQTEADEIALVRRIQHEGQQ